MKTKILLIISALLISSSAFAQTTPEPASKLMSDAFARAKKEKKNVMVVFHASWCGWCKKFEASVTDPACKDYFDRSFIFVYLTVLENGEKKKDENPGAPELFKEKAGDSSGIPFFLIYDKNGKQLADSKIKYAKDPAGAPLSNMGCPAQDEEVAAFVNILKKTSKISDKEAAAVTERFKKNSGTTAH